MAEQKTRVPILASWTPRIIQPLGQVEELSISLSFPSDSGGPGRGQVSHLPVRKTPKQLISSDFSLRPPSFLRPVCVPTATLSGRHPQRRNQPHHGSNRISLLTFTGVRAIHLNRKGNLPVFSPEPNRVMLVSCPAMLLTLRGLTGTPSPGPARQDHPLPHGGEGCIFWSTLSFVAYSPLGRRGDREAGGQWVDSTSSLSNITWDKRPALHPHAQERGALLDDLASCFTREGQDEQAQDIDQRDGARSARK